MIWLTKCWFGVKQVLTHSLTHSSYNGVRSQLYISDTCSVTLWKCFSSWVSIFVVWLKITSSCIRKFMDFAFVPKIKFVIFMSPPTFVGRHIVFVLSVCPSVRLSVCLSVTQFVSATPLKLLNRISWNLVDSKDTICSCAYYAWILWELCPFELRNFPKFTAEAACQRNSSETTEQNFMKLGR